MTKMKRQDLPPEQREVFWVERLKGNERQQFVVYSPTLWGCWTHYNAAKKETTPCYEDERFCHGGHEIETMRWRGYVFAWSKSRMEPVFIQLTPGACRSWLKQLAEGATLRGQLIEVWRTKSDKGRLLVAVNKYAHRSNEAMPQPPSPIKSLYNMWHVTEVPHLMRASVVEDEKDLPDEFPNTRVG